MTKELGTPKEAAKGENRPGRVAGPDGRKLSALDQADIAGAWSFLGFLRGELDALTFA
jgi:hypothetical protein